MNAMEVAATPAHSTSNKRLCWQWGPLQLVQYRGGRVIVSGLACRPDLLLQSVVPANLQAHAQDFVSTAYVYSVWYFKGSPQ